MTEQKLNVEDLINYSLKNWPQDNMDACATAVRLIRAGDLMLSSSRKIIEQLRLTPAEFDTLATLRKMGAPYKLTPSELCRANLLSSGGLTKILIHLEQQGFISRQTHESDKRSRIVALTDAGKCLIEEVMATVLRDQEERLSSIYSAEERQELNRLLRKFHLASSYLPNQASNES